MKKGMFFTLMAIFIIIILIAVLSTRTSYRYREKSHALSARVRTMNDFLVDVEKDLGRALYIGGYRAILSLNGYLRDNSDYIEDLQATFGELLTNGTMNGTSVSLMSQGPAGADISSWTQRINQEASKMNLYLTITINNLTITQATPWDVRVDLNASLFLDDTRGTAHWNVTRIYSQEFSILGFEDPLYIVETNDRVTNIINVTPFTQFVEPGTNDTTNLTTHMQESYYLNNTEAPSYLMRFTGDFSPSPFGIESMVNIQDLVLQDLDEKIFARSNIDYIYFGEQDPENWCNIQGMISWFRIDKPHASTYGIDQISNKTSC